MPRTQLQLQHVREERRMELIAAALTVFARVGYEGASIRAIAQQAGVAQGLLYNYFASKDELLRAIFEVSMSDVRESFARGVSEATPQQRLERLIRSSFTILDTHRDFWRLSYGVRMQPSVLAIIGDLIHSWTQFITTTLESYMCALQINDSLIEAVLLFAHIDGIAQHYVLDPDHFPLEAVISKLVSRYVN